MPYSYGDFRCFVLGLLDVEVPDRKSRIIDLGAGEGSFGSQVREMFPNTDAVEICGAYVTRFKLIEKYRHVFVMDAAELTPEDINGTVFHVGDMLEHLDVSSAQALLSRLQEHGGRYIVVVVPYLYEQASDHPDVVAAGNPHEIHRQPDLTHELFLRRYPSLTPLVRNERCGVYAWKADQPPPPKTPI